ncbi:MAG: UDP-2,4-diacetamido-2,4,6-trideoxy-beta-L-altropyranose hydrolase [Gelidibacter sp.]
MKKTISQNIEGMTSNKTIVFRADGNSKTGLGHLYRLFALVETYKPYFEVVFATKETTTMEVIPKGYNPFFIPNDISIDKEPEWLSTHFNSDEYIIIADGYHFDGNYQKQIKNNGFKLIYIDDLIHGKMYADILVNHAANIDPSQYKTSSGTQLALGTDYAILRPSFIKAAQSTTKVTEISNAFVCFGGADALDLSLKATKALLQIPSIKSIHVVLGAAYSHSEIFELAKTEGNIQLHKNLDEESLCQLMAQCQLAIAPASTIVYELCSVKMPMLSGYFVDNQKNIYKALLKEGAIYGCGDLAYFTSEDFREHVETLLAQNHFDAYLKAQQRLFDGQSPNRFIHLLNTLFITFRKATEDDVMLVYDWSNDPMVRQNSYDSKPIVLEHHKAWFSSKIKDGKTLFLIALYDHQPAGIVRYEIGKEHSVVGVLVAENFRGRKLSATLLSESAKHYFKQNNLPIFAYIKEENKASIKAFENAGYSFYKQEIVKESPSFVYKLEMNDHKR